MLIIGFLVVLEKSYTIKLSNYSFHFGLTKPLTNLQSMMVRAKTHLFSGRLQENSSKERQFLSKAPKETCSSGSNQIQFCLQEVSKLCSATCPMAWEASTFVPLHNYVKLIKVTVMHLVIMNVLVASNVVLTIVQPAWSWNLG